MATFIINWNPKKTPWPPAKRSSLVRRTSSGKRVRGRWSTGTRKTGITPGQDRVFLLRQGVEPRGVIASGWFTSEPYGDAHWDGTPGKLANYADISWDRVVEDDDLLPLDVVKSRVRTLNWNKLQSGGVLLASPGDARLERIWTAHAGMGPRPPGAITPPTRRASQGWQSDPAKRRLVENHAQALLEKHYRKRGWKVQDTRRGNPFDAVATKGKQRRYLEAKGTETGGASVLVTHGEVRFARNHPDECVIGIVSGIRFRPNGDVDEKSGKLVIRSWNPDTGALTPRTYTWKPPEK